MRIRPEIVLRQQRIDEIGHGQREGEFEQAGNDGAAEVESEQALVRGIIGKETLDH